MNAPAVGPARPARWRHLALLLLVLLAGPGGCRPSSKPGGKLVLFHAGSLSVPMRELATLFESKHPDITVEAEAAGSRDTARKVSDLGRRCDVLASADYQVVESLLLGEHADFNILFATNAMVLAYGNASRGHADLSATSWPAVLLRQGVRLGRSDPQRDPCGYRTVMVFQLAERATGRAGLAAALEKKAGPRFIRPKETDLLALLESGEIDYMFIYRSLAKQHHLRWLELGERIDLSSPGHAADYAAASVQLSGPAPGQKLTRRGAPIAYSVTIPKRALRPTDAEAFVGLLLSDEGRAIFDRNGQQPIAPARAFGLAHLPASLRPRCADAHGG